MLMDLEFISTETLCTMGRNSYKDRTFDRDVIWGNSMFFEAGVLALDTVNGKVYRCIAGHTSSACPNHV